MRTKPLAIEAAEQLSGKPWSHLVEADGCTIERVRAGCDFAGRDGFESLFGAFPPGDRFVVFSRALAHKMPDDWQAALADLVEQYRATWRLEEMPTPVVGAKQGNRFARWPDWVGECCSVPIYSYGRHKEIEELRK